MEGAWKEKQPSMNIEAKRVPFICLQVQVSSSDGLAAGLAAGLGVGRRGVGGGPSRGGPASHIDQIPSSVKTLQILGQLLDAKVWDPWDPTRRSDPSGRL